MKTELKQKIKNGYEKHKVKILVGGTIIAGFIMGYMVRSRKEDVGQNQVIEIETIEVLPEWTDKWMHKCDDENLLYENGLPIFADSECMVIYSDALDEGYSVEQAEEHGFTVIERA